MSIFVRSLKFFFHDCSCIFLVRFHRAFWEIDVTLLFSLTSRREAYGLTENRIFLDQFVQASCPTFPLSVQPGTEMRLFEGPGQPAEGE